MTPEQKAAYVVAQAALLNAELAMAQADNKMREMQGYAPAYDGVAFADMLRRYEATIGHNAIMELFKE